MDDTQMRAKRDKEPHEYGKTKYLVELFLTERFVLTIFADTKEEAVERARRSPHRQQTGSIAFSATGGMSHLHFDEDYDFTVTHGDVIEDDDC